MHANAPRAVVVLAMTTIALIWSLPLTVHAETISLVATLDPFPLSTSYFDVWGEGDYAEESRSNEGRIKAGTLSVEPRPATAVVR